MPLTQDSYEVESPPRELSNKNAPDAGQGIEGNDQHPSEEN